MNKNKQNYVIGAIISKDLNDILVIHKTKGPPGVAGKINLPGGKIEKGEYPSQAIIREIKEETNLNIKNWKEFAILKTEFGDIYCFYVVTNKIYNFKQIEEEKIEIINLDKVIDFNNIWYLKTDVISNLRYLIPMALNHYLKLDKTQVFEIIEDYHY